MTLRHLMTSSMLMGLSPRLLASADDGNPDPGGAGGAPAADGAPAAAVDGAPAAGADGDPAGQEAPKDGADAGDAGQPEGKPDGGDGAEPKPDGEQPEDKGAAPEKYELKVPEGLPEGTSFDTSAFEKAEPLFRDLGLTGEQAQKVVDTYAKDILPVVVPQVQAQVLNDFGLVGFHKWEEQCREDPRFGGQPGKPISPEAMQQHMADVARFRDQFGTPALAELLENTTIGNHPEIVAAFAKAGKALADDNFHRSDVSAQGQQSLAEKMYGPAFAPKP